MTDADRIKAQDREIRRLRALVSGLEQVIADLRDELAGRKKERCKTREKRDAWKK